MDENTEDYSGTDLAKDLGKELVKAAVRTVVVHVAAFAMLGAVGTVVIKVQERKAKKTSTPEDQ